MPSTTTEVSIQVDVAKNALVALFAYERYLELLAGNVTPSPWEEISERIPLFYEAVYGSMWDDDDSNDFTERYKEIENEADAEVRKFLLEMVAAV